MTKAEVMQRLQDLFDGIFLQPVKVTEGLSANDVAEWDSLLQITIVVTVEQEFKVRFRIGEVEATKNVGQFADLILKRMEVK